jgi:hypothetical protein
MYLYDEAWSSNRVKRQLGYSVFHRMWPRNAAKQASPPIKRDSIISKTVYNGLQLRNNR